MLERILTFDYHPPLASFPFALLSIIVILEFILIFRKSDILRNAVTVNLLILAVAMLATFFSGLRAESLQKIDEPVLRGVVEKHYNLGRLLLFSTLACLCSYFAAINARQYKSIFMLAYYLILLVCFGLVLATGYIGADMVFKHAVGVVKTIN